MRGAKCLGEDVSELSLEGQAGNFYMKMAYWWGGEGVLGREDST